ncbi:hypothetical protein LEN26_014341 [Aphanomyces euteiches]|nr:hypothetical protein LEN26_014341 [Aphanomyces euteiches]
MNQAQREISSTMKVVVIQHLQRYIKAGKLVHGAFSRTANELSISRRAVASAWHTFCANGSITSNKAGRVGPNPRYSSLAIQELVRTVPTDQRSTMRDISMATGISIGTVSRHLKKGTLRRRSSRIKPLLSDANKLERVNSIINRPIRQSMGRCPLRREVVQRRQG